MTETKTDNLEREYIIPLREEWNKVPRYKRANKAIRAIKEFLARHMKVRDRDLSKIKIDRYLNEEVWFRGIKKPPAKIKVKATKEGDIVRAELFEMPENLKFKKAREEKREQKASELKKEAKKEEHKHEHAESEEETEEKKAEEKEKKSSVVEAGEKMEKEIAKKQKHEMKAKTPKQEKNQRVGYNQSSRGK